MGKIIGIDLGTSNSAAAAVISGKPTIIPSAEGVSIGGENLPRHMGIDPPRGHPGGVAARGQWVV